MESPDGMEKDSDVFFPWKSDDNIVLSRRMAAIYCDEPIAQMERVKTSLEKLEFETRLLTHGQLEQLSNFGNIRFLFSHHTYILRFLISYEVDSQSCLLLRLLILSRH